LEDTGFGPPAIIGSLRLKLAPLSLLEKSRKVSPPASSVPCGCAPAGRAVRQAATPASKNKRRPDSLCPCSGAKRTWESNFLLLMDYSPLTSITNPSCQG